AVALRDPLRDGEWAEAVRVGGDGGAVVLLDDVGGVGAGHDRVVYARRQGRVAEAQRGGPEVTGAGPGLRDVQVDLGLSGTGGVRVVGDAALGDVDAVLVQIHQVGEGEEVGLGDRGRAGRADRAGHGVQRERDVDQVTGVGLVGPRAARGAAEVDAVGLRR